MEAIQKNHEENMKSVQPIERSIQITSNSMHTDFVATMCLKSLLRISVSTVIIQPSLHLLIFIYSPSRKSPVLHTQAAR